MMDRKPDAPSGIGWWIWYLDKALNGRTVEQLAKVCEDNGVNHLFLKTSDGAYASGSWAANASYINALQKAGLKVYSWSYNYGDDPAKEAEIVNDTLRLGVDGHVFDIEGECEGKSGAIEWMWQIVRTAFPDAWLGYAPLPVIDYHDPALYAASNKYADAVLPQFYWAELGPTYGNLDGLFARWLRWAQTWATQGQMVPDIMPIGQAYGSSTEAKIAAFVAMCKSRGIDACSFWEWGQSTDAQWNAVMKEAKAWEPSMALAKPSRFQFELGFDTFAASHPDIGDADSEMIADKWGNIYQDTICGRLVWWKRTNEIEYRAG